MERIGKEISCDYPGCKEQVLLEVKQTKQIDDWSQMFTEFEPKPKGWGTVGSKDLCPDHYQYYQDALHEFWHPTEHEDSAELKDEDILYTNMKGVKVTGPEGTIEAHVEKENW